jgi:hypothetical protein
MDWDGSNPDNTYETDIGIICLHEAITVPIPYLDTQHRVSSGDYIIPVGRVDGDGITGHGRDAMSYWNAFTHPPMSVDSIQALEDKYVGDGKDMSAYNVFFHQEPRPTMPLTLNPGDSGGGAFYVRADGRHVVCLNEGTWSYHDFDGQQVAEGRASRDWIAHGETAAAICQAGLLRRSTSATARASWTERQWSRFTGSKCRRAEARPYGFRQCERSLYQKIM